MLHAGPAVEVEVLVDLRLARLPSAGSLIGNFTRPSPLVTTFDMSAEYSVEIASSEKWMSSVIPKTSS